MKALILPLTLLILFCGNAQNLEPETIVLSRTEAETLFLKNNLSLLAEKLNIEIANAQIIQARVWPNPTFALTEVNLWSNPTAETMPVLWGNFGRKQEFGAEIEQLLITAGKRKKRIAIEEVSTQMASEYYEDVLRSLKIEFRNSLSELEYNQELQEIYRNQLQSIKSLLQSYAMQLKEGNINQDTFIRLRAAQLEYRNELNDLQVQNESSQKELKVLLQLNPYSKLVIEKQEIKTILLPSLKTLIDFGLKNRPDLKNTSLNEKLNDAKFKYENALRIPDVTFQASYDRGGNIMRNFFGVGFSIDLPIFDRNQGNRKAAQFAIEQGKYQTTKAIAEAKSEIIESYNNFMRIQELQQDFIDGYEEQLDQVLEKYTENFKLKNINLLAYLDFAEAYLKNKTIIINSKKDLNQSLERLKYTTTYEIK